MSSSYSVQYARPADRKTSPPGSEKTLLSFRLKLMLLLSASIVISVLVISLIASQLAEAELKEKISAKLDALSSAREHEISSLVEQDNEMAALVVSRTQLRKSLVAVESGSPDAETEVAKINEILDDALASVNDIESISVTDTSGRVVASTDGPMTGMDLSSSIVFQHGSRGFYLDHLQSWEDELHYSLSAPMADPSSGDFIGIAVIRFNEQQLEEILLERSGLGESGELVLGQPDGDHIDLWYPANLTGLDDTVRNAFQGSSKAVPMQLALRGEKGTTVSDDYRGVEVLASFKPVPDTGWGLVAKVDSDEAYEPIAMLNRYLLLAGILLTTGSVIAAWFFSRIFSRRILALRDGVRAVSAGDLDTRLEIRGNDELQELGQTFNSMTSTLAEDRSNRIHAEEELQKSLHFTQDVIDGIADPTMVIKVEDYRVTLANKAVRSGLNGLDPVAGAMTCHETSHNRETPCTEPLEPCPIRNITVSGEPMRVIHTHVNKDGIETYVDIIATPIFNDQGEVVQIIESCRDITDLKLVERELRQTLDELERSNIELQQFADVASHDLQEPLRMIASYVQLLRERYGSKLDADADEFIDFAVEGANRLQETINDLLSYSRVSTHETEQAPVDSNQALKSALENLKAAVHESGASVRSEPLPTVYADSFQISQLFQNLISNAIKFRGDDPPQVEIAAVERENEWLFSVSDNGIGIDKQYNERIFTIFQRLHTKEKYAGTGVGLAICKRIVERHGGRIWVESEPGHGSIFYFTIRKGAVKQGDAKE